MHNLGLLYDAGGSIPQDYKKAFYYFEMASKLEYVESIVNLGIMYSNGQGVDVDGNL
jgi:uncharacterized protein